MSDIWRTWGYSLLSSCTNNALMSNCKISSSTDDQHRSSFQTTDLTHTPHTPLLRYMHGQTVIHEQAHIGPGFLWKFSALVWANCIPLCVIHIEAGCHTLTINDYQNRTDTLASATAISYILDILCLGHAAQSLWADFIAVYGPLLR